MKKATYCALFGFLIPIAIEATSVVAFDVGVRPTIALDLFLLAIKLMLWPAGFPFLMATNDIKNFSTTYVFLLLFFSLINGLMYFSTYWIVNYLKAFITRKYK